MRLSDDEVLHALLTNDLKLRPVTLPHQVQAAAVAATEVQAPASHGLMYHSVDSPAIPKTLIPSNIPHDTTTDSVADDKHAKQGDPRPPQKRHADDLADNLSPAKRLRSENAKQPSIHLAQSKSFRKLASPFRSPLIKHQVQLDQSSSASPVGLKAGGNLPSTPSRGASGQPLGTARLSHHSRNSSLSTFCTPNRPGAESTVSALTIQRLERRLQVLKRAKQILASDDEAQLQALVVKWRAAGRAVSWDLWELVRAGVGPPDADAPPRPNASNESWGWADDKHAFSDGAEHSEGTAVDLVDEVEVTDSQEEASDEEPKETTLGTMLAQLGISPETLGWNEEEGDFVEA